MKIAWHSLAIDFLADRNSTILRKAPADRLFSVILDFRFLVILNNCLAQLGN